MFIKKRAKSTRSPLVALLIFWALLVASSKASSFEGTTAPIDDTPTTTIGHSTETTTTTLQKPIDCHERGEAIQNGDGEWICNCTRGFFGHGCQYAYICGTELADGLSGYEICETINIECVESDKFWRCNCDLGKYFHFEMREDVNNINTNLLKKDRLKPSYIAECLPIDKCVGVKCNYMSEVCVDGVCKCDEARGFVRDTRSDKGECKLLNVCDLAAMNQTGDSKQHICGEAKCVSTFDKNLFECVCPIGYEASIAKEANGDKSKTQCIMNATQVCNAPLLNKCQHTCEPNEANNNYTCQCLGGYKLVENFCYFDTSNFDGSSGAMAEKIEDCANQNKTIVLDSGNKLKCHCKRQGFVELADGSCVEWCYALESDEKLRNINKNICHVSSCNQSKQSSYIGEHQLPEISPWRPQVNCNCGESPVLELNSKTGLCELNFLKALEPCMPNNDGHNECVIEKKAFCAVLYKPNGTDVDFDIDAVSTSGSNLNDNLEAKKRYACVCEPGKKFFTWEDKKRKRKKIRCVNECELISNECGRFNKMCRNATWTQKVESAESLYDSLNLTKTLCQCLPGFSEESLWPLVTEKVEAGYGEHQDGVSESRLSAKSHCYLDFDVVEFRFVFKAPADFDPTWLDIRYANGTLFAKTVENMRRFLPPGLTIAPNSSSVDAKINPIYHLPLISSAHPTAKTLLNDDNKVRELQVPYWFYDDTEQVRRSEILVGNCSFALKTRSFSSYDLCIVRRYWLAEKMRHSFVDWRQVLAKKHLQPTLKQMDHVDFHINSCETKLPILVSQYVEKSKNEKLENLDADLNCTLTLQYKSKAPKVKLQKQLRRFILPVEEALEPKATKMTNITLLNDTYYMMTPNLLIHKNSIDRLGNMQDYFLPCLSEYHYCDNSTRCEMAGSVNYTCKCKDGYTQIATRNIYFLDSRREVCVDIDECLFDACQDVTNSTCKNSIGGYSCDCDKHYTSKGRTRCTHICEYEIDCKKGHGQCRVIGDSAVCECEQGYKGDNCSVQDPSVALRKANTIIIVSIFTSIFLLTLTITINLSSQLRKARRELRSYEQSSNNPLVMFDFKQAIAPRRY